MQHLRLAVSAPTCVVLLFSAAPFLTVNTLPTGSTLAQGFIVAYQTRDKMYTTVANPGDPKRTYEGATSIATVLGAEAITQSV